MSVEHIDTVIVGGGQAGLAMSRHLSAQSVPHRVLEKHRIAERWRTARWDSLVANGPAWHDRFPDLEFDQHAPDAFVPKDQVATYFERYAEQFDAPIRCGVEVRSATRIPGRGGFRVETTDGVIEAQRIVAATGPFQRPVIPSVIPGDCAVMQLHSSAYRNPDQLPAGAVMIVGAGSSGVQIADELARAGRKVYLSVGPHERPPRSYRGRDFCWWLGVLGKWDAAAPNPGTEHVTIAVSGAHGGHTVDFRNLAGRGVTLVGRTETFDGKRLHFRDDLAENLAAGDASLRNLLSEADAYVAAQGLDLPPEPEAHEQLPDPDCVTNPLRSLDLSGAGIGSVIWATGFKQDYSWLKLDIFDAQGRPRHQRGVSVEPGVYFLGLPWQSRRGSSFIWGVWHDARYLADQIVIQRSYMTYHDKTGQSARDPEKAPAE
ncbi:flavin-containing monooxygenase [Roseinatronobacter alkalisoli]|uniref:NAD(P)/FAD-dependent oxidoreductase n=1 Tax=Roseinatronobacter alkalisoli TaxID=3028235 RepID=A0ABT5TFF4_9RHOB|nr:NAD(P)/FAD-dependent oxidoreductase [Roseinatronobacter sp. HJB301]MDD7973096.1 NAD(P)/FAD-dependent oxidoreductase [Roseinatronobacter sp. HJB301]